MIPSIFNILILVGLMGSLNSWAKVVWVALTSLSESKSANTGMDFYQKVMKYRIHGTYVKFPRYSTISLFSPSLPVPVVSTTSSLIPITGVEVAITGTSFIHPFLRDIWCHNVSSSDS